jgi:hypothetical protein
MRVNINNTENIKVNNSKKEQLKLLEEAVDIIEEKMKAYMQKGDYLRWYKSDPNLERSNIAAVYNRLHEETKFFARIVG